MNGRIVGRTTVTVGDDERNWRPDEVVRRYLTGVRDFRGVTIEAIDGTPVPSLRGTTLAGGYDYIVMRVR